MLDRPRLLVSTTPRQSRGRAVLFILSLLSAAAAAACTKTEGTSSGTAATGTAASSAPAPSASMTAMATPDAAPMAADAASAAASASAAPAASGSAATTKAAGSGTPVASASAAPAECGTKPLPDCPLQGWMKANTSPAIASNDLPALATALEKIVTFAPPGYTNWASIAKDGAKAAKASDMTAAKASCRTCHDQYKDKYKKEMRARKI